MSSQLLYSPPPHEVSPFMQTALVPQMNLSVRGSGLAVGWISGPVARLGHRSS